MKSNIKVISVIFAIGSASGAYSMMQEQNPIQVMSSRMRSLDITGYKNINTNETQNEFIETIWRDSMQTIHAFVNNKDLSGLKPLFSKVQEFSDAVFNTAKIMYGLRDGLMKDKIKTIDAIKKKQSEIKKFLVGQKIKSAFSFGKKEEQYKDLKQLLMDIVDILNNKIENMKKDIEIKKK